MNKLSYIKNEFIKNNFTKNVIYIALIVFGYYITINLIAYFKNDLWYISYNSRNFKDYFLTHSAFISNVLFVLFIISICLNLIKLEFKNQYNDQNKIFGISLLNLFVSKSIFIFCLTIAYSIISGLTLFLNNIIILNLYNSYFTISLFDITYIIFSVLLIPLSYLPLIGLVLSLSIILNKYLNFTIFVGIVIISFFCLIMYIVNESNILKYIPFTFNFQIHTLLAESSTKLFKIAKIVSLSIIQYCFFYFLIYKRSMYA